MRVRVRDRVREEIGLALRLTLPAEALAGQAVLFVRLAPLFLDDAFQGGAAGPDKKVFVLVVVRTFFSIHDEYHEQSLKRVLTEM